MGEDYDRDLWSGYHGLIARFQQLGADLSSMPAQAAAIAAGLHSTMEAQAMVSATRDDPYWPQVAMLKRGSRRLLP